MPSNYLTSAVNNPRGVCLLTTLCSQKEVAWDVLPPAAFDMATDCSTCMNVYTYIMSMYVCMCVRVCMHMHMSICMCVCMYVCVCMHVCMCVCVYACMYVCMHVCMCVCLYACVYVCVHVCMCVCV